MLTFAEPWIFIFLLLPLLARWLLPAYRQPALAVRAPFTYRLGEITGHEPSTGSTVRERGRLQWFLLIFMWICVVTALARPQWIEEPLIEEQPLRDLLLAVDLSGSMATEDFTSPAGEVTDRLTAVKTVLEGFLSERDGDRIGLVFFGSAPFVQAPFTTDIPVVQELLMEAQVRMLGPRTMMGDAMGLGINLFERSEVEERVMIVLTDGNDTGSAIPPTRAADIAADEGVTVHTVAIGDPEAAGEQALDETTLRAVAQTTGGMYFHAEDQAAMAAIYDELDKLNPKQVDTISFRPRRELFPFPLGLGMGIGLLGLGLLILSGVRNAANRESETA